MAEVHGNRINAGNAGKTTVDVESGAESGALDEGLSPFGPDLQAIIDAWPNVPADTRRDVLALLKSAMHASL